MLTLKDYVGGEIDKSEDGARKTCSRIAHTCVWEFSHSNLSDRKIKLESFTN